MSRLGTTILVALLSRSQVFATLAETSTQGTNASKSVVSDVAKAGTELESAKLRKERFSSAICVITEGTQSQDASQSEATTNLS